MDCSLWYLRGFLAHCHGSYPLELLPHQAVEKGLFFPWLDPTRNACSGGDRLL
jgi:hypothetical protein